MNNFTIDSRIDRDLMNRAYSGKISELMALLPGGSMDIVVLSRSWLSGLGALEAGRVIEELARVLSSGGVVIALPNDQEDILFSECWQLRLRQFEWSGWHFSSYGFVQGVFQQFVYLLTIKDAADSSETEEWQERLLTSLWELPADQLSVGFPACSRVLCCEAPEVLIDAARRGLAVLGLFENAQQVESLNKVLPSPGFADEQQEEQA